MISDTLSEATEEIRWYLNKMPEAYVGLRPRIDSLITEMEAIRIELDTPPNSTPRNT